jgi:hypothetical protein
MVKLLEIRRLIYPAEELHPISFHLNRKVFWGKLRG